ncbi:hypothetical protein EVAR_79449_1 [Eumeta japonica]|uniref:Uncharacterized protein n=1 Tax=Eumeta variegata TaxID=151549 RepID=A0A4C1UDL3_EUMVA|nr:hypothetical protein EVAR_79449_1 [Eumeta japonica]
MLRDREKTSRVKYRSADGTLIWHQFCRHKTFQPTSTKGDTSTRLVRSEENNRGGQCQKRHRFTRPEMAASIVHERGIRARCYHESVQSTWLMVVGFPRLLFFLLWRLCYACGA